MKFTDEQKEGGRKINMCKAIEEMMNDVRDEGIEQGIRLFVIDNIEEGLAEEKIIGKLVKKFGLSEEQAKEKVEKYKA